jgi:hypothetical protein
VSVSNSVYTVEVTPSGEGDIGVSIAQSVAADLAGNVNTQSSVLTVTYDTTPPTVTLSSVAPPSFNTPSFSVSISFSESTNDFDVNDITVTNGTLSNFSGSGTSYTVDVQPIAEGIVEVSVAGEVAHDIAGNGNVASATMSRTYDVTGPTVDISSTATAVTNRNPFPVTLTFNEPVTGFIIGECKILYSESRGFTGLLLPL